MENRLKKVYISYKHDENYNGPMEAIKRGLEKNGIYYSIDVQDIKYRDDIVKYEYPSNSYTFYLNEYMSFYKNLAIDKYS